MTGHGCRARRLESQRCLAFLWREVFNVTEEIEAGHGIKCVASVRDRRKETLERIDTTFITSFLKNAVNLN